MNTASQIGAPVSVFGDWIFTTQFTGSGEDFRAQAVSALQAMLAAAAEAGLPSERFIHSNVMLSDVSQLEIFLSLFRELAGPLLPTISFVPERRLIDGSLFGIEVFGAKGDTPIERFYGESDFDGIPSLIRYGDYGFSSAILSAVTGAFDEECRGSMERLLRAMDEGGFDKRHFAKNLVLITDCANFNAYNAVYAEYYDVREEPPARSLYGVSALPGGRQVSVETVAYLGAKQQLQVENGPKIALPFCHASRIGKLVLISGQIGLLGRDQMSLEFGPQTIQMLKNVALIAAAAGSRPGDYLKFNAFVTDISNAETFRGLFREQFPACTGAAPLYEVNGLAHPFIIVEMDAVSFIC